MNNTDLITIAKNKVKAKKHFYTHFTIFWIVTFSLFTINYFTTPGTWWFLLPIVGWAMAVIGHYLNVFGLPSFKNSDWEEEQFEIELEKLERTHRADYQEDDILDISDTTLKLREMAEKERRFNSDDIV